MLLLLSLLETTRMVISQLMMPLTLLPLKLRRLLLMPHLRLPMIRLQRPLLRPESKEISMLPLLLRRHLMPTLPPTKRELLMRRINWREDRTKIDLSSLTRTPPPRLPKFRANMTKEREQMPDLLLLLPPSDYDFP